MEKITQWWSKLSTRDKRAVTVLAGVCPIIFFWYFITAPLQERLSLAQRVLKTSREQAIELQHLLNENAQIRGQAQQNEIIPGAGILVKLEKAISHLDDSCAQPRFNRINITMFDAVQPGAELQLANASPKRLWELLEAIDDSSIIISEFELTSNPQNNTFNLKIKVWKLQES